VIFLQSANRKRGRVFTSVRVRAPEPYGHDQKWTLILAIDTAGYVNHSFEPLPGTTSETFAAFCVNTIDNLPAGGPMRTFMWDNLSSHYSAPVDNVIANSPHHALERPPYRPVDGPIEYAFNHVENELSRRLYLIHTERDLVTQMNRILAGLGSQDALFAKLGYQ